MPRTTLLRSVSALAALAVVGGLMLVGQASFGSVPKAVKVARGDTLWALSRRYGVTVAQLASANHMRPTDTLYAGRTLYLPSATSATSATAGTAGTGGRSAAKASAAAQSTAQQALLAAQQAERTFCTTYRPPTGPRGQLPSALLADPSRLALRPVFAKWAAAYHVPVDLIEGEAWQESGWSNTVVSPAGAVGIGQLLPATAAFVNQTLGTNLQLNVASDNIEMMAAFLSYLLRATGGQVCGAVASYYEGLGNLQAYGVLPVSQAYVRDVLSLRPRFA